VVDRLFRSYSRAGLGAGGDGRARGPEASVLVALAVVVRAPLRMAHKWLRPQLTSPRINFVFLCQHLFPRHTPPATPPSPRPTRHCPTLPSPALPPPTEPRPIPLRPASADAHATGNSWWVLQSCGLVVSRTTACGARRKPSAAEADSFENKAPLKLQAGSGGQVFACGTPVQQSTPAVGP